MKMSDSILRCRQIKNFQWAVWTTICMLNWQNPCVLQAIKKYAFTLITINNLFLSVKENTIKNNNLIL